MQSSMEGSGLSSQTLEAEAQTSGHPSMPQGKPWTESKCLVGKTPDEKRCILHHPHLDLTAFQTTFPGILPRCFHQMGGRERGLTLYSNQKLSTLFDLYTRHLPETPAWGVWEGRGGNVGCYKNIQIHNPTFLITNSLHWRNSVLEPTFPDSNS